MMLAQVPRQWVDQEAIAGSERCASEEPPWPPYTLLDEPDMWRELRVLARPQSTPLGPNERYKADSVNFQPAPSSKTQDRYVVTQLEVNGRLWAFTGVFDGHLGDVTVEHVSHHLPIIVREFLTEAETANPGVSPAHDIISGCFNKAITAFDDAIAHDVLDLFGGSVEELDNYTDAQIREIINDQHKGGANWQKARLCMYGTTALVALVDPDNQDLWIANLGDCEAFMASPDSANSSEYKVEALTATHNGDNPAEIERVQKSHPGEPECVVNNRVLGAIAPTRCFGDIPFKQPPAFTRRILYNLFPGFHNTSPWEEFLVRNQTPPYITAEPQIIHRRLVDGDDTSNPSAAPGLKRTKTKFSLHADPPPPTQPAAPLPRFLILASDGFSALCDGERQVRVIESWARSMVARDPPASVTDAQPGSRTDNMALRLLRLALGGDDRFGVSRMLTLDVPDDSWMDDTSIVIRTI
ncbi:phosphatase 2C-like domain-containing protein [Pholiota molesta]|nr:phosphatase 2C-like domain-containing protein [Pholiota molesta]